MKLKTKDIETGEEKLIEASELTSGKRKHHKYSLEFIRATTYLHHVFHEVDPIPFISWFEDFDRDTNPEKELIVWLRMARYFEKLTKKIKNLRKKKDIYAILLRCSTGVTSDQIISDSDFKKMSLTKREISIICDSFKKTK